MDGQYAARTVRHSNAVLRNFYDFWIDRGGGPLLNPVALDPRPGRSSSGDWPRGIERPRTGARIRYNPRLPKRRPRAMPDPQWNAVFAAFRSNWDRALVSVAVSSACRRSELLVCAVSMWKENWTKTSKGRSYQARTSRERSYTART